MNIIEVKDLVYAYPGSDKSTLNGISLEIEKGDFLAVIGNNGCGKSTLCKVMNGLIPHFITGKFEGTVLVDGEETKKLDIGTLAKKVGYVYQDFENQIVRPTVLDDASYACMNYAVPDYEERGREALRKCGLEGKEKAYIWQLSGGQTHLLALAGAVSLGPDVLILDEPIAQLDPAHADGIYEILRELNEEWGKTIIVIEHHTEYIAQYCKHVVLLKEGKVQWKLPAKEALARVEELWNSNIYPPQVTIAAHNLEKNGCIGHPELLPVTMEDGKKIFEKLVFKRRGNEASNVEKKQVTVSFDQVEVSYRTVKGKAKTVFEDLRVDICRGEKIALIGSNGAGKSTMMKLMTGLMRPSAGSVKLDGIDIKDTRPEQLSRYISLVYQNPEDMFIKDSIEADISYAMQTRNIPNWKERTGELLERFRLTELKERDGRLLSGGQMRRASLAIGIALQPKILLLDEPTANLDIATRKEITNTLDDIKDITETVVIATHDMQLVCEWAERIIVLCSGKIVADGTRDEIFGDVELLEMVGIRPPEIFTVGQALNQDAFCYTVREFVQSFGGNENEQYDEKAFG